MHNSCTFLSNFQQLLFCRNRYNEKQRMCMSSVRKYNDEIPSVLHDRPRRFVKQAIKKLANPSSSLSSYNTNLKDITCDCLDYTYHGPWCKHLLEQAIASGSMTDTAYNTLDFQGHNLIPYTLQEKKFSLECNLCYFPGTQICKISILSMMGCLKISIGASCVLSHSCRIVYSYLIYCFCPT